MDDLHLQVVPITSVALLWYGKVETIVKVELAALDRGMCKQRTMVELFALAPGLLTDDH